jgi:uncharacterized membrane protein YdjX (TVP38/TMEM64 family)
VARFVLVFLFLAITVALPFVFWGDQFEAAFSADGSVQWLKEVGPYAWLSAIGLLVADLVLPIPTTAVMAGLGIIYGPWVGGMIATIGSVVAGLTGYCLCRWFGRPIAQRIAGQPMLAYGQQLFDSAGGWLVALSRWQPILPEVISCIAGLSRMRADHFFVALLCGSAPLGFVFAFLGHSGQSQPILTMAFAAVAPVFIWFLMRPLLRRIASRAGKPAKPNLKSNQST